ncbi:hypothetical protein LTR08_008600 [Meristemomyces frigidus]|nr:hypothetical protein LTR08_008600 [Meristemomyces frigidus]
MPSHLRLQASFEPLAANATYQTSPASPPAKKQKMSLTQTYYVASTARSKLGREASRADHDLRVLVGHANLLDNLMLDLAHAEREQEAWFNQSINKASKPDEPKHIQWIDTIAEEEDEDDSDAESDDGSDTYDEDAEMFAMMPLIKKMRSPPVQFSTIEIDDDDDEDYDQEDDDEHSLTRVSSKHSPPELTHDADSDSEDDSMPSSPETEPALQYSEKKRQNISATGFYDVKSQQQIEDYDMQQTHSPQTLIPAY